MSYLNYHFRTLLLVFFSLAVFCDLNAQSYYISPDHGTDGDGAPPFPTGQITDPFKSTAEFRAWLGFTFFEPFVQDNMIVHLDMDGEYGSLIIDGNASVTIDSYDHDGNGVEKPLFNGATSIDPQDWIWDAPTQSWRVGITSPVKHVYWNGQLQLNARYPKENDPTTGGWLRNENHIPSNNFFGVPSETIQENYLHGFPISPISLVGATAIIRTSHSRYVEAEVRGNGVDAGNFLLSFDLNSIPNSLQQESWGFYLRNMQQFMDQAGEWAYHDGVEQLYFKAPAGSPPENVEYTHALDGIISFFDPASLVLEDLAFTKCGNAAVIGLHETSIQVTNCDFDKMTQCIKTEPGSVGTFVNASYCTFKDIYGPAFYELSNGVISYCEFHDVALRPGLGINETGGYSAISAIDANVLVHHNTFKNIGHSAIEASGFIGSGWKPTIHENYMERPLSILNDGSAIEFNACDQAMVYSNIIKDVGDASMNLISAAANSPNYKQIGYGIKFGDDEITNSEVYDNTITGAPVGIHVDHTKANNNNVVRDNVLFSNGVQLSVADLSNLTGPGGCPLSFCGGEGVGGLNYQGSYNTTFSGNVMYSLHEDQLCLREQQHWAANSLSGASPWVSFGTFGHASDLTKRNYYFNPFTKAPISVQSKFIAPHSDWLHTPMDLDAWKDLYAPLSFPDQDGTSTESPLCVNSHEAATLGTVLLNDDFNVGVNVEWDANCAAPWTYQGEPCMELFSACNWIERSQGTLNSVGGSGEYQLKFRAASDFDATLWVSLIDDGTIEPYAKSAVLSPGWAEYTFYFRLDPTSGNSIYPIFHNVEEHAGMNINGNNRFYIDDVSLTEVTLNAAYEQQILQDHILLYNNLILDPSSNYMIPGTAEDKWFDVDGNVFSGGTTPVLPPFNSKVLYRAKGIQLDARVFLAGADDPNELLMREDLRVAGLIPLNEPYTNLSHNWTTGGGETTTLDMLATPNFAAIVDWVVLELRDPMTPTTVIADQAALIRRDGNIVDPVTGGTVVFEEVYLGPYYVAIRHRNHLGVMRAFPSAFSPGATTVIDFRVTNTPTWGTDAMQIINSVPAMWSGNTVIDNAVKYTGPANDRDPILVAIGGSVPTNTVAGYYNQDVNMDGIVKYTGMSNDRDPILVNIGGAVPTNTRQEQLP